MRLDRKIATSTELMMVVPKLRSLMDEFDKIFIMIADIQAVMTEVQSVCLCV